MPRCGFLHQRMDQLVSDDEHLQFITNHRGCFAAKLLHTYRVFNVSKEQLNSPSLIIQIGEIIHSVNFVTR